MPYIKLLDFPENTIEWSKFFKYIPPRVYNWNKEAKEQSLDSCEHTAEDPLVTSLMGKGGYRVRKKTIPPAKMDSVGKQLVTKDGQLIYDPVVTRDKKAWLNNTRLLWEFPARIMTWLGGKKWPILETNVPNNYVRFIEIALDTLKTKLSLPDDIKGDKLNLSINNYKLTTISGVTGKNCTQNIMTFARNPKENFYINPNSATHGSDDTLVYDFFTTDNSIVIYIDTLIATEPPENLLLESLNFSIHGDVEHDITRLLNDISKLDDITLIQNNLFSVLSKICKKNTFKNIIFFIPFVNEDTPDKLGRFVYNKDYLKENKENVKCIHVSMPRLSKKIIDQELGNTTDELERINNELDSKVKEEKERKKERRKVPVRDKKTPSPVQIIVSLKKTIMVRKEQKKMLENLQESATNKNIKFSQMRELTIKDDDSAEIKNELSVEIVEKILAKTNLYEETEVVPTPVTTEIVEPSESEYLIQNPRDKGFELNIIELKIKERYKRFLLGQIKDNKTYNLYEDDEASLHNLVGELRKKDDDDICVSVRWASDYAKKHQI